MGAVLDQIYNDHSLFPFLRQTCEENESSVGLDGLTKNGGLDPDLAVVIKVDEYYNSLGLAETPPSIDCLIVVECKNTADTIHLYLIELRDVAGTAGVREPEIRRKFETTVNDFIFNRFRHLFPNDTSAIAKIEMWVVTDPLRLRGRVTSEGEYKSLIRGSALDAFTSMRPIRFDSRAYLIEPRIPAPEVVPC